MTSCPRKTPSPWEAPAPVLLNGWKHHAGALRERIREAVEAGDPGLSELAGRLVVIGTELMDLYIGDLTPTAIADQVLVALTAGGHLAPEAFRGWVAEGGGYRVTTLPDESGWVLRLGDADRYVHVHPARWAPQTRRVRANVLKTAILVLAYAGVHGGDPLDRALVNRVRQQYLGLAPMGKDLAGDQGLGGVIDLLRQ